MKKIIEKRDFYYSYLNYCIFYIIKNTVNKKEISYLFFFTVEHLFGKYVEIKFIKRI